MRYVAEAQQLHIAGFRRDNYIIHSVYVFGIRTIVRYLPKPGFEIVLSLESHGITRRGTAIKMVVE